MKKNHFFTLILVILFFNSSPTKAYSITGLYQDANNVEQPFSKYEGKVLLVEGFATDCPHCQDEHKELDQLWESYNALEFTLKIASLASTSGRDTKILLWNLRRNAESISQGIFVAPLSKYCILIIL